MREPKDIIINGKTLEQILIEHKHWADENCEKWVDMRANLGGADLHDANLRNAELRGASFRNAELRDANFNDADLCLVDFNDADLRLVDFRGANLQKANLHMADLRGADLRGVNLHKAILDDKEKIRKGVILTEPMIGWKKCQDEVIVQLEIPRGAIVFSINNLKCRTNKVIVKKIIGANRAYSYYKYFSYYVGDSITVYNFNCQYNEECGKGIHFFRTREEAEKYHY